MVRGDAAPNDPNTALAQPMPAAVACLRCGAPVFAEDRFCGACGTPRTPSPAPGVSALTPSGATSETSVYGARLLAMLRQATIGEYEVRGEIGRGGMAAVYLAYDLRLNRKVAIKVMLPELAFHEGMEDRFKREARTAAKLDHPNVVVIYSVRDDAELLYFVMKYIEGASLEQLVRKYAPLPIPIVQHVLVQLAGALQYAHDEGVVHRDVKPANVLVDRRGNALVTDFGIAKATESPQLTRTGSMIGTPAYMSPEQCMGEEQTHASDQYSLGVVAYELIAGRPPFVGPSVELQWAHVKTEPPSLLAARPDCPPALAAAVMRMLAKDAEGRWPSLQDVVPSFAAGLIPGDDTPRRELAGMVRIVAPVRTDGIAVTPASPLPRNRGGAPAAAPVTPVTPVRTAPLPPPPPAPVSSVRITPPPRSLEVGEKHQLACTSHDAAGNALADREVYWASSNPGIASANADGEVLGVALGKATIAATVEAITSTVGIEVAPDRVASVSLTPVTLTIEERTAGRLNVHASNARGKAIVGRQVILRSSDPAIVGVGPDGAIAANTVGRAVITASLEGQSTTAEVIVRPTPVAKIAVTPLAPTFNVGDAVVFSATLFDAKGRELSGRAVSWRSSNTKLLKIDATGHASATRAGTVDVTAESEGVSSTVHVAIAPPAVARADIAPASTAILSPVKPNRGRGPVVWALGAAVVVGIGAGVLLLTRDRSGGVTNPPPRDSIPTQVVATPAPQPPPPPPAASVDSQRNVRRQVTDSQPAVGGTTGGTTVKSKSVAELRVTSGNQVTLTPGGVSRATIRATTADGATVSAPNVAWTSSDPTVATVSKTGTVSAVAEGRTAITARSGSAIARIDVTVSRPAPAEVAISPRPQSLKTGEQANLGARVRDRAGLALPYQVVWRSSNPAVATVDNTGGLRGVRPGDATIIATAGAVADSIRVTVTAPAVVISQPPPADSTPVVVTRPGPATRGAPSESDMDAALVGAARTMANAFSRGQLGMLTATGAFSKLVRDAQPKATGAPQVQQRSFANGRVEGDVSVPLRWKTFTGNLKDGAVTLHITLEQQGGALRATAARNTNNP